MPENDGNFGANSKLYLRCNNCGEKWPDGVAICVGTPGCCQSPNIHIWSHEHNWTLSWPGNMCKDCGLEDPVEYAVGTDPDFFMTCPVCLGVREVAEHCQNCMATGCIPNPARIPEVPPCPGPNR